MGPPGEPGIKGEKNRSAHAQKDPQAHQAHQGSPVSRVSRDHAEKGDGSPGLTSPVPRVRRGTLAPRDCLGRGDPLVPTESGVRPGNDPRRSEDLVGLACLVSRERGEGRGDLHFEYHRGVSVVLKQINVLVISNK